MANDVLPTPQLTPTASPVDRFVRPREVAPDDGGLGQLVESLSRVNPQLQQFLNTTNTDNARQEEAAGAVAAEQTDITQGLRANQEGWQQLISEVRAADREQGTDNATALVGASPHFRRGLVKAKATRLALGLQTHLQQQWENDVGGIKSVDDADAVGQWVREQASEYSTRMGLDQIDPVITSEVYSPRAMAAEEQLITRHLDYRSRSRVAEYTNEFAASVGMMAGGMTGGFSSPEDWIASMSVSESGGNYQAANDEGFVGLLQFGQDRLDDYNRAHGTNITTAQFREDDTLQDRVNLWHVRDIDSYIQQKGYLSLGYSLDGMRAVAHLGGKGGLDNWIASGGRSNPSDSNGTSLQDYYNRFAGAATEMQSQLNTAISNGVSPTKANETLVESVIAQARAQGDASIMDVLDSISTGSGTLGNIGWVKAARIEAEDQIADRAWEVESRTHTLETREREEQRREMRVSGIREIFEDPFADHSEAMDAAREAGHPDVALEMHNLSEQLRDETYEVRTNHEAVVELRRDIFSGEFSDDEIAQRIVEGTGTLWGQGTAVSMFDDLDKTKSESDWVRDPEVRRHLGRLYDNVEEKVTMVDVFGNTIVSGGAVAAEAEQEVIDNLLIYLEDNPEASRANIRRFVRDEARRVRDLPEYQPRQEAQAQAPETAAPEPQPEQQQPAQQRERASSGTVGMNDAIEQGWTVQEFLGQWSHDELQVMADRGGISLQRFIDGATAQFIQNQQ